MGGIKANLESGITIDEIKFASSKLSEKGGRVTNFNLKDLLKGCCLKNLNNLIDYTAEAKFLLVRNGINTVLSELDEEDNSEDAMKLRTKDFYQELIELKNEREHTLLMKQLEKDFELKKINNSLPKCGPRSYKDTHHTKQDVAEHKNLYFKDFYTSEAFDENDVENILIDDDLYVGAIRSLIPSLFPDKSYQKFYELYALGNYDSNTKHPIKGYQGDTKGKMVIGINPGKTVTMCFQWFLRGKAIGQNLRVSIPTGSLYMMSEKATGHDWKKSNILTLRHCLVDKNSDGIIPECQKCNRFHMNLRTRI